MFRKKKDKKKGLQGNEGQLMMEEQQWRTIEKADKQQKLIIK